MLVKDLRILQTDGEFGGSGRLIPFGSDKAIKKFVDLMLDYEVCESCGFDMELSESFKTLFCPNDFCGDKAVIRLRKMLLDMNVTDMGEVRCEAYLKHWNTTDPLSILTYDVREGVLYEGASLNFSKQVYNQVRDYFSGGIALHEYIKVLNLPNIASSSYDIFSTYSSLEQFYRDIHEQGVILIQDLLGIKKDDLSVRALSIYETLMTYRDSIMKPVEYGLVEFKGVEVGEEKSEITLYVSTSAGKYGTKKQFMEFLNSEFPNISFVTKGLSMGLDFLIGPSGTTKHTKALGYQAKGSKIQLMEAEQFVEYLQGKRG